MNFRFTPCVHKAGTDTYLEALYFKVRTRSPNSLFFNVMQIVGAVGIGMLLDSNRLGSRPTWDF